MSFLSSFILGLDKVFKGKKSAKKTKPCEVKMGIWQKKVEKKRIIVDIFSSIRFKFDNLRTLFYYYKLHNSRKMGALSHKARYPHLAIVHYRKDRAHGRQ